MTNLTAMEFFAAASPEGRAWLAALPSLVGELARRWGLAVADGEIRHGYNAVIVPAVRAGVPCALKVAWPPDQVRQEAAALAAWDGRGAVTLIDADLPSGALLLERLDASRPLTGIEVMRAGAIAGAMIRRLAIEAPSAFPPVRETAGELAVTIPERQRALAHPVPGAWVALAARLAEGLARDLVRLLIHADLHYENILTRRDPDLGGPGDWVAIDPKPLTGAPERSAAELLWTRADELAGPADITALLAAIVDGGRLDPGKAAAWSFVRTVDYWLWGLENSLTVDPVRCERVAGALAPLAERVALA